jgi:hypothetical protein
MADHPHTIDRWDDATGENLIEQVAAVGDYLVAARPASPAGGLLGLRRALFAHTKSSNCHAGRHALRAVARPSRAHK